MAPYPLRTTRVLVEPLVSADVPAFTRYRRHPDVARWQSWTPDYSEVDARGLIEGQPATELPGPGGWIQLAIRPIDGGELLGDVAIHRLDGQPGTFEVGITLAPSAQGRGVASETLRRVLDFLFDEKSAHRVLAQCDARNEPVARLLDGVGMRHESRQVEADWFKGEWTTLDGFAILAREYRARATTPPSAP